MEIQCVLLIIIIVFFQLISNVLDLKYFSFKYHYISCLHGVEHASTLSRRVQSVIQLLFTAEEMKADFLLQREIVIVILYMDIYVIYVGFYFSWAGLPFFSIWARTWLFLVLMHQKPISWFQELFVTYACTIGIN